MICPTCYGRRLIDVRQQEVTGAGLFGYPIPPETVPCPDCNGHGSIHCCDGLRECPELLIPDDR